uniref:Bacterial surface antigen (D15) domain-containing protein n=1 Tax=candidate division WOR-3 bacterium TaxID=2052148 RepID=A0A7C6A8F0_UNCW3
MIKNLCRPFIILLLIWFNSLFPQYYFSKNKVQYRDFDFKTLETEHLRIYFYSGGEYLAEFVSKVGEEFYQKISEELAVKIEGKIPVIIYNSPNEFEQTNIILDIIEESVGGFSELFKNRVVLPFTGSYSEFRSVLAHELTHIFEFEMFYKPRLQSILSLIPDFQIPLWVMEGFAEFLSSTRELNADVFIRDLVINERLVPIDQLSDDKGYLCYREGEAIFRFIEERYGRKKVIEFLHNLKLKRNLTSAFQVSFGMTEKEFSERWEEYLKIKYWPQVVSKKNFSDIAQLLTNHRRDGSTYNTSCALSPTGTKIAFISDRSEYTDVYIASAIDGKILRRLVKGERSAGFESMHLFRGGIDWSSDEKFLVLVAKSGGRDGIVLCEYPSGRIRKRLVFDLDGVYSPQLSSDNQKVTFVGVKNGFSDIYVADIKTGDWQKITYDIYEDRDPSFSPSGDTIVFVSDRPKEFEWSPGSFAIFLWTKQNSFEQLTCRQDYYAYPIFTPDGKSLIYTAGDSSYNLYIYSLTEKKVTNRTKFLGGVYYPSIAAEGEKLAFSYYNNLGWDIAIIREPLHKIPLVESTESVYFESKPGYQSEGIDWAKVKPYIFSLSLDYAIGAAGYSTHSGVTGTAAIAFSDALGNHRFYIYTDLYRSLSNSEFYLSYWLLPKRIDWGVAIFQYFDYPELYYNYVYLQQKRGIDILTSYPFNKFFRLEVGFMPTLWQNEVWRYIKTPAGDYWEEDTIFSEKVFILNQALIFDNTYWLWTGPIRGTRARAEIYQTVFSDRTFYTGYFDYRNYQKLAPRYTLAARLAGIASFGKDAERFYLGGEYVRGYEFYEFYQEVGTKLALASIELRHPFIDRFKLAFPLPIDLRDIRGVTFIDAGMTVRDTIRDAIWENGRSKDLKVGIGAGLRFYISYLQLRFDWAWPLSELREQEIGEPEPGKERKRTLAFYFSIGSDF